LGLILAIFVYFSHFFLDKRLWIRSS
jgi:hypothetical protein